MAYQLDYSRRLSLATEGDVEAPLIELPPSVEVEIAGTGVFTFDVSDGERPGTHLLVTEGEPDAVTVEGTIDGEPLDDPAALEGLGGVSAVPEELEVNVTGAIHRRQSVAALELFPASIMASGLLGPLFPGQEVAMGEGWSFIHPDRAFGSVEIEREVTGRISGQETVEGIDALVVEGESQAAGGEVDMSAFYRDFLTSFGGEIGDPKLVLAYEPLSDSWKGWLEPEQGRLIKSEAQSTTRASLAGEAPDRITADPVAFQVRFEIDDRLDARLVSTPTS